MKEWRSETNPWMPCQPIFKKYLLSFIHGGQLFPHHGRVWIQMKHSGVFGGRADSPQNEKSIQQHQISTLHSAQKVRTFRQHQSARWQILHLVIRNERSRLGAVPCLYQLKIFLSVNMKHFVFLFHWNLELPEYHYICGTLNKYEKPNGAPTGFAPLAMTL